MIFITVIVIVVVNILIIEDSLFTIILASRSDDTFTNGSLQQ